MRREGLLRHLRRHGRVLCREGLGRSTWENPRTGHAEAVLRHIEISNNLARVICRRLWIPDPPG
ncbi:MAG: addiction module toxin, HicA family [Acidobacteria bacterium]|nr:addiction module toxin, HicA family [Acidobacteriota bacterium]